MNKNLLSTWALSQAILSGLGVFLFHALLTKQYRGAPWTLGAWLAAIFVVVLVSRQAARNTEVASRSRWQQAWADLDRIGLVFVVFFFVLLLVFDNQYFRATADGREYFAHVRSLVIDFDLEFANENTVFRTGGVPEHFPFGSAVLWLPFFVAAHLWLGFLNLLGGSYLRDGFHNTYQMAVGLGTLCYGYAGLLMIYRIGRDYFAPRIMAAATILLTTGSFLVWYLAIESSYTHGNSLFAVTLFVLIWYRTRDARSPGQWAWFGAAAGVMIMVRWQNAVFLLFPAFDIAAALATRYGGLREATRAERAPPATNMLDMVRGWVFFGVAAIIGFFPQMLFWRVVNGGWLALPHGQSGQQWWSDSLVIDVLFSSNHGLVAWHPLIYLALLGIPLFVRRDLRFGGLLTLIFLIQVYINGAVATWWGGHAFGGRRFASCALLFALGLAAFIRFLQKRPLAGVVGALSVLVAINAFLIADIKAGRLPTGQGLGFNEIVGAAYARLGNPFSFPANVVFGRRQGMTMLQYDELGLRMYNNLSIDMGVDGDERYLGRGWAAGEETPRGAARWALGPESVVIAPLKSPEFLLPGQAQTQPDYALRFRANPFRQPDAGTQVIEFRVNGERVAEQALAGGVRDYEIVIPGRAVRRNLNEIVMRYAYWRADPGVGTAAQRRPLAVRFYSLELIRGSLPRSP